MTRQEAIAAGATRYTGKRCELHPSLNGERRLSNGNCVACGVDNKLRWQKAHPEEHRKRERSRKQAKRSVDPVKYRAGEQARRRERRRTDSEFRECQAARKATRRALKLSTSSDRKETERAWRALKREGRRLGLTVDHRVPLKPCRVCGKRGKHEPSNFALQPYTLNSAKSNRCMSCWMLDTGTPVVVWGCDKSTQSVGEMQITR